MKKPLKIGLALVIGASVLGIFSDPEPSENRTYEEQQVEEQTPEKDWHEQVLKSLEQKEETEIPDYDQKTQYVDLMKSSLDQDLPVRSLTIKGEGWSYVKKSDKINRVFQVLRRADFQFRKFSSASSLDTGALFP